MQAYTSMPKADRIENLAVSVVIPNFNNGMTLGRTLDSIVSQQYPALELIVIDGGSTDGSLEVIRSYEDHITYWVSEPDEGQYDAINKGFARATGDIFFWINADDISFPWSLRTVASFFRDQPDVQWIMGIPSKLTDGVMQQYNPNTFYPQELVAQGFACEEQAMGWVQQESCFWRRSLWESVGGIPHTLKLAGDFWLWREFARKTPPVVIDAVLGGFNYQQGQRSVRLREQYLQEVARIQQEDPLFAANRRKVYRKARLCKVLNATIPWKRLRDKIKTLSHASYPCRIAYLNDGWKVATTHVAVDLLV